MCSALASSLFSRRAANNLVASACFETESLNISLYCILRSLQSFGYIGSHVKQCSGVSSSAHPMGHILTILNEKLALNSLFVLDHKDIIRDAKKLLNLGS